MPRPSFLAPAGLLVVACAGDQAMAARDRVAEEALIHRTLGRTLHFETLERRRVLSADFAHDQSSSPLSVDVERFAADTILVRLDPDAVGFKSWQALAGTRADEPLANFPLLRRVQLEPGIGVEEAIALYSADPLVAYAEPDYQIQLTVIPDDPQFDQLWGLHNTGQTGGMPDIDIDAPEAWEVTQGNSEVIVAVIDTGVDYRHPDLAGNMWVNPAEQSGLPNVDDDGNGYVDDVHGYDFFNRDGDPLDDHNHGTHVAGTIGAIGDDGVGVVGVNWHVQIMALKFLGSRGNGAISGAIEALNYAVANGASISNNSWGIYNSYSQALRDAIADADQAGHIFVAAAGNGDSNGNAINIDNVPFYPANYDVDNVISVAAIDHQGQIASFSNYGAQSVDLGAPGVSVLSTTIGNTYRSFSGTSMATPHVTGVVALVRGLHPEWTSDDVIAQVLGTTDPLAALDGITVTGGRVNAATAVGNPENPGPEVMAYVGSRPITGTQSVVGFGLTAPGSAVDRVIGLRNIGTAPLTLSGVASVPAGFVLVSGPDAPTLAPGEQTSIVVRLEAVVKGTYGGAIVIGTNDADENPLLIDVVGEVDFIPLFVDNGDSKFDTIGVWNLWNNQGYLGDVHESFPGDGSDVARWTFDNMAPGLYEVAATWTPNPNRATDAPFRIFDDGRFAASTRVNQQASPDDFLDAGVGWVVLDDDVAFMGGVLTIELSNAADGRLNADAIRVKRIDDLPLEPDVVVIADDVVVEDGVTSIDFGATPVGADLTRSFTIRNGGLQDLVLAESAIVPAGFVVVDGFGDTTLAPGETTSFSLRLDAALPGTFGGVIQFGTNDPNENPFQFLVTGAVVLQPMIIDNGAPGFTTTGEWTLWGGQGYQGDVHESLPGTGADVATWTFANLPPGQYQAAATWTREWNRASDAPFALLDGATPLHVERVDQTRAPAGFADQGVFWDLLGQPVAVISGTLVVSLADNANGRLNADAIRVQRVGDLAAGPALTVASNGQAVGPGSVVDFGVTSPGAALERTFTLRNAGSSSLTLTGPILAPAGFSVTSGPAATTLASGESTTFVLALDAASEGLYAGVASIPSNDPEHETFVFSVEGLVEDQPIVIDDFDAGFTTVGEWTRWTNQGFQGDVHESLPGVGNDVARWTFAGLNSGRYVVAATWTPNNNRASDAKFTVLDGATQVGFAEVNQRIGPAEFTADGAAWNTLAEVTLTGGTLTVRLSDDANGRLNADAIRIERIADLPGSPAAELLSDLGAVELGATFDFGRTLRNVPISRSFLIRNIGVEPLELTSTPTIPTGYTLTSSFTPAILGTGESVEFTLRLDAASEDFFAGEVTVATSDPGVGTIRFIISGLVAPPPRIIDNGNAGFTSVGEWTLWGGQGFGGDVHESLPGSGADVATWTFDNLLPGRYSVAATWTTWSNRATNSPFSIFDGAELQGTVTVNQQVNPNGFVEQGVWWKELGQFDAASGTLLVTLNDAANGRLNADAIRVELVEPFAASVSASWVDGVHAVVPLLDLSLAPARKAIASVRRPISEAQLTDLAFEQFFKEAPRRAMNYAAANSAGLALGRQPGVARRCEIDRSQLTLDIWSSDVVTLTAQPGRLSHALQSLPHAR